jgi:hypothetical protein
MWTRLPLGLGAPSALSRFTMAIGDAPATYSRKMRRTISAWGS